MIRRFPVSNHQVMLLRDKSTSKELGQVLWAAFKEVENFYNEDAKRMVVTRTYLSEEVPGSINALLGNIPGINQIWDLISGTGQAGWKEMKRSTPSTLDKSSKSELWDGSKGTYLRTYDAGKINGMVRALLGLKSADEQLLIVIDQELTPPADFRYIIWDRGVISILPTDPNYWRMEDEGRRAIIKHRVRTACLSITGLMLGLRRCNNENCFLFSNVDSIDRLDGMVTLGPEHGFEALQGRGYQVRSQDPEKVQPIIEGPEPDEGWWAYVE